MSDIISLASARDHLRVGDDVGEQVLDPLIAAAEQTIADELGRDLLTTAGWATVGEIPANVVHAIKLVLADLYENRITPLGDGSAVRALIGRYVLVSFG